MLCFEKLITFQHLINNPHPPPPKKNKGLCPKVCEVFCWMLFIYPAFLILNYSQIQYKYGIQISFDCWLIDD